MSVVQVILWILFPSSALEGFILSVVCSLGALLFLWKRYEDKYSFNGKEKLITFTLSLLFMMVGTVLSGGWIPIITWSLYAFHFMVDRKYMELPDGVTLWIAIFSIFSILMTWERAGFLQAGILSGIILFTIFLLLAYVGPMGGGDIKLMGATGLYFTLMDLPSLLFYGFLIGAVQGIGLILFKKEKINAVFAFGPALILGILATVYFKGGMFHV